MRDGNNVEGQDKKAECEAAAVCNTNAPFKFI
jgi:hypothetical protein